MSQTSLKNKLNAIAQALTIELKDLGQIAPDSLIQGAYSQESLGEFRQNFDSSTSNLKGIISAAFQKEGLAEEFEDMSLEEEAPMKAAVIAALVSQKALAYHNVAMKKGTSNNALSLEGISDGIGGSLDIAGADTYSQEAFEDSQLANFNVQNIIFNALASRQDTFSEAFFPTKTVPVSEGGLTVTVDRQEVIDYKVHPSNGGLLEQNRRSLIEAYKDPSVLARQGTDVVPHAAVDGANDAMFIAESLIGSTPIDVSGIAVPTRPLLIGTKINLLGLSNHPGLLDGGVLDMTDQLAPGMKLGAIYASLTDGTSTEVLKFNTSDMFRNQFRKSHEGRAREVALNFITETLIIDPNVSTSANIPSALLEPIKTADVVVRLAVSISGNGDVNQGFVEVNASPFRVVEIVNANKESLSLETGAGKTIADLVASLKLTVEGYDLKARRSNSNWRSTGAIIDVTPYSESYAIELGYPITVLSPTDDSAQNSVGAKLAGMINGARIRNSNNAVGALLNYAEQLEAYQEALARGMKVELLGAGRHIVVPYFFTQELDVAASVENRRTGERADDAAEVIVNTIRDQAWKMYRDSNYGPALDMANGGGFTKPKLLIGVDAVTKRYLDRRADARLLGGEMDYEVVSTNDDRMEDTIVMTFTTGRPGSDNGLGFGTHAYVVELIQSVTKTLNGATAKQDRVVPRSIHVPVLPIMSVIKTKNLSAALTNK